MSEQVRSVQRTRFIAPRVERSLITAGHALLVVATLVAALFPLFWVLLGSFKLPADVMRLPPVIVFEPTIANYLTVIRDRFVFFFENSVVISGGSVLLTIIVGVPAAYGLSRLRIRFKKTLMLLILSVRFAPYIIFALPLFLIMSELGLIGHRPSLVIVYTIINLPVVIWLMRAFFDDIPTELDEAAAIDGASRFRTFMSILVPCARPGIATVTILSFIFAWNEYLFALILSGRDSQTLTVGLTRFLGGMEDAIRWGQLSAWSVSIVAPIVILALLVNRHLRRGFTGGLG